MSELIEWFYENGEVWDSEAEVTYNSQKRKELLDSGRHLDFNDTFMCSMKGGGVWVLLCFCFCFLVGGCIDIGLMAFKFGL